MAFVWYKRRVLARRWRCHIRRARINGTGFIHHNDCLTTAAFIVSALSPWRFLAAHGPAARRVSGRLNDIWRRDSTNSQQETRQPPITDVSCKRSLPILFNIQRFTCRWKQTVKETILPRDWSAVHVLVIVCLSHMWPMSKPRLNLRHYGGKKCGFALGCI